MWYHFPTHKTLLTAEIMYCNLPAVHCPLTIPHGTALSNSTVFIQTCPQIRPVIGGCNLCNLNWRTWCWLFWGFSTNRIVNLVGNLCPIYETKCFLHRSGLFPVAIQPRLALVCCSGLNVCWIQSFSSFQIVLNFYDYLFRFMWHSGQFSTVRGPELATVHWMIPNTRMLLWKHCSKNKFLA